MDKKAVWTLVVALILFVALLWSARSALSPYALAFLLGWLTWPFRNESWGRAVLSATAVVFLVWFLQSTRAILAPFLAALLLAYIFHPLVTALERRHVRRAVGSVMVTVLLFLVPIILLVGLVPTLGGELQRLAIQVPGFVARLQAWAQPALDRFLPGFGIQRATEEVLKRSDSIVQGMLSGAISVGRGIGAVATFIFYVFLIPSVTFFLLRDFDRLGARFQSYIPDRYRPRVRSVVREINLLWGRYLRGQVAIAAILGVLAAILFLLFGIPYALLLGVLTGTLNLIPRLGIVLTIIPAVVIALLTPSPLGSLVKVAIVFGILQILETTLISPRIAGKSVGLHPVTVMVAVLIGGYFFGFVGLLVAVPFTALGKVLLERVLARESTTGSSTADV